MKKKFVFLLWMGASISIAEIATGSLLAPLGLFKAIAVIVAGHLIGIALLALGGYVSFIRKDNAMASLSWSMGRGGGRLLALANVIQLTGWTVIMIVQASEAFHGLFNFFPYHIVVLVIALLILFWALNLNTPISWLNNIVVCLLAILCLFWFGDLLGTGQGFSLISGNEISLALGLELSIAMPVSWLPLVGDYSHRAKTSSEASLMPFLGYFIGSVSMYILGLLITLNSGRDIFAFIAESRFKEVASVIVLLSTLTTAFLDLYSAAISSRQLIKVKNERLPILVIGLSATVLSIFLPIASYQDFLISLLLSIGMVFIPVYTVVFMEFCLRKKRRNGFFPLATTLPAGLGMVAYYFLTHFEIWIPTLITMILVSLIYMAMQMVLYHLKDRCRPAVS